MRTESWRPRNAALAMGFCLLCVLRAHVALAAAAPVASPAAAPAPADYKVGPGDLLRVNVFGSPELATDARVSQSGAITVSLIGSVPVAGLSTVEAEKLLAKRFIDGGFLRQPQVSVLVVEYESQKINVLGHVVKPGQYALRASASVLDVLADAGGVMPNSAGDTATLMRSDGTKREIDLDALFRGDQTQNVTVAGGDRIFVPRAEQFYIYGQVQKPGVYRLERNMTVSRAITAGGGLTARGTERRAIVKRRDAGGAEKEYSVKPTDVLKADDVLFIKESLF
jgi:polysaccharide export outer membrane protein